MIAIDTNVLVYAHRLDLPDHAAAKTAVDSALSGVTPVGIAWPVVHEFLAVVSNSRVFIEPTSAAGALAQVEHWLSSPAARPLGETSDHLSTLTDLLGQARVAGGAIHDARIAAICIDHGVRELWTVDRDFSRFPALRVHNPMR